MPTVSRLLALIPASADCVGGGVGVAGSGEGIRVGGTSVIRGTGVLALTSKAIRLEKMSRLTRTIKEPVKSSLRIMSYSCTVDVLRYNFPQLQAANSGSSGLC